MTAGASRVELKITRQPALAPSPQPRPAPTARALPPKHAGKGGQNWTPIGGQIWKPIDSNILDSRTCPHFGAGIIRVKTVKIQTETGSNSGVRPVLINSAQCPLRSESDRFAALPRNDALCRVSRAPSDEGGPFEAGSQVLISSHRK